jgi:hypothetical protein
MVVVPSSVMTIGLFPARLFRVESCSQVHFALKPGHERPKKPSMTGA